ncbi:MAG: hypothetical protein ACXWOV_12225 [Isosphaeraceae bacterium]
MKFESKNDPLLSRADFLARLGRSLGVTLLIVAFSLLLGGAGYHYFALLPWIDAVLNASMILTGMGPVDPLRSTAGKLFATFYCLYSGIAFLTMMAVLLGPVIHRLMHKFHLEESDDEKR